MLTSSPRRAGRKSPLLVPDCRNQVAWRGLQTVGASRPRWLSARADGRRCGVGDQVDRINPDGSVTLLRPDNPEEVFLRHSLFTSPTTSAHPAAPHLLLAASTSLRCAVSLKPLRTGVRTKDRGPACQRRKGDSRDKGGGGSGEGAAAPPWRQPRGKLMVSLVNSHTNATRIGQRPSFGAPLGRGRTQCTRPRAF